jgi:hypothetical protein
MTYPWVDLSVIVSKNRRVTNAGRPAGPVRSGLTGFDRYRYRSEKNLTGYNSGAKQWDLE